MGSRIATHFQLFRYAKVGSVVRKSSFEVNAALLSTYSTTSLDPAHRPQFRDPPTKPSLQAAGDFWMISQPLPGPEHLGVGAFFQPFGQGDRTILDNPVGVIYQSIAVRSLDEPLRRRFLSNFLA